MIPGFGRTGFGRDELYPDMGMFLQKLAISTKKTVDPHDPHQKSRNDPVHIAFKGSRA
jgi:hypothetical protein